ncbi:uncharacterized protein LOC108115916 [Drosophila eugracilis]|uniref:uncharacterized protein LOC108115916 n=1 Tax=Drosophila eugracilis TaxID=29029 RepID=UPI001BDB1C2A|nr:uncharacterized protein LOC108115916 [Drosophila eugracilis]
MHSLLVCVSALCFCQLCQAGAGIPLCKDCRVNVIYPGEGKPQQQLPENHQIVRIINDYRRITKEQMEIQDEIRQHRLQVKDFNFIAKVKLENVIRCSAALVGPRLLITSSTCFVNKTSQQLRVLFPGGRTFDIDSIVKPDSCPEISLLLLKSEVSEINPIYLCHQDIQLGINASMMMASPDLSFYGRRHTKIISNEVCQTTFFEEDSVFTTSNMMCAMNSMTPDKCATSPGDALLIDHKLCGINIYGFRCFVNELNGDLYINLSKLQPMIGDLIRQLNVKVGN